MGNCLYPGLTDNCKYYSGLDIKYIAEKYGTPTIIYNIDRIYKNIDNLKKAFGDMPVDIHYAVKSNYNPYIVRKIIEKGCGIDAANYNEAKLALICGSKANQIIATPNNLSKKELESIVDKGITINFDHAGQMELIKDKLLNIVSFRINPGIGRGEFAGITTAGKDVKFGISEDQAIKAYNLAKSYGVQRFGIHMMTGSNVLDPEFFDASSSLFFNIARRISDVTGIEFEFLDLGGGFGVPYGKQNSLDIKKVASYINKNYQNIKGKGYFKNSHLIIEPGRFIMADSAILVGSVTSVKESDHIIVGTDASMNTLIRIPLYGAHHELYVYGKNYEKYSKIYDIVG